MGELLRLRLRLKMNSKIYAVVTLCTRVCMRAYSMISLMKQEV